MVSDCNYFLFCQVAEMRTVELAPVSINQCYLTWSICKSWPYGRIVLLRCYGNSSKKINSAGNYVTLAHSIAQVTAELSFYHLTSRVMRDGGSCFLNRLASVCLACLVLSCLSVLQVLWGKCWSRTDSLHSSSFGIFELGPFRNLAHFCVTSHTEGPSRFICRTLHCSSVCSQC